MHWHGPWRADIGVSNFERLLNEVNLLSNFIKVSKMCRCYLLAQLHWESEQPHWFEIVCTLLTHTNSKSAFDIPKGGKYVPLQNHIYQEATLTAYVNVNNISNRTN